MDFDASIVGAGPGGLTAAMYLARAGRKVAVFERIPAGGQAGVLPKIDNYPGMPGVSGYDLIEAMTAQVLDAGAKMVYEEIVQIDAAQKTVHTAGGSFSSKTVILSTGCGRKHLGLAREEELNQGRGISYCAVCDGMLFKKRTVAITGGFYKMEQEAAYLKGVVDTLYVISNRPPETEGVVHLNGTVTALFGDPLSGIEVTHADGSKQTLAVQGLFVSAGNLPQSRLLAGQVQTDADGFIQTDAHMQTSAPGVYAVGDVRQTPLRQIVTAAADGALAAMHAIHTNPRLK